MFVQIAITPARLLSGLPGSALLNSFPYKARVSSRNGESDLATPLVLEDESKLVGVPVGSSRGFPASSATTYRCLKVQNSLQLPGCPSSSLLLSLGPAPAAAAQVCSGGLPEPPSAHQESQRGLSPLPELRSSAPQGAQALHLANTGLQLCIGPVYYHFILHFWNKHSLSAYWTNGFWLYPLHFLTVHRMNWQAGSLHHPFL